MLLQQNTTELHIKNSSGIYVCALSISISMGAVENGKAEKRSGGREAVQGNWWQIKRLNLSSSSVPLQHAGTAQISRDGWKECKGVGTGTQEGGLGVFRALSEAEVSHHEVAVVWFYRQCWAWGKDQPQVIGQIIVIVNETLRQGKKFSTPITALPIMPLSKK